MLVRGDAVTAANKRGIHMIRRGRVPFLVIALGALVFAVTAAWAGVPNIQRFDDPVLVYGPQGSSALRSTAAVAAANPLSDPRVFVDEIVIDDVDATVTVTLTASFRARYVCVHGHTPLTTGTTLAGHVTGKSVFRAMHGHTATGSVLTPKLPSPARAAAATGFTCSSGTLKFNQAVFSDLVLAAHGGERIELHGTLVSHPVYG